MSDSIEPKTTTQEATEETSPAAAAPGEQRGIPEAEFIEDVAAHLVKYGGNHESGMKRQNENYGKYKLLENSLLGQRATLTQKLPEIRRTLAILEKLDEAQTSGEVLDSSYLLSDNAFAKASITPSNVVCLWLGANIMVEYSYEEALTLLRAQEKNCAETLKSLEADALFLRDQLTTTEVNIARIYNHDVQERKKREKAEGKASA